MIRQIDWSTYLSLVDKLAEKIQHQPVRRYEYIFGVPRGGLLPAVMLSHRLTLPLITHLDYNILATSNILVVDDIVDSGKTIRKFDTIFDTASVFVKRSVHNKPLYYCTEGLIDDEWLVFPYEVKAYDSISHVHPPTEHLQQ